MPSLETIIAAVSALVIGLIPYFVSKRQTESAEKISIATFVDERVKLLLDSYERRIAELESKIQELERENVETKKTQSENEELKKEIILLQSQVYDLENRSCMNSDCKNRVSKL